METTETKPRGSLSKFIGALLSMSVVFIGEIVGYLIAAVFGWSEDTGATAGGAVAATIMVLALGGKRYLKPSGRAIAESFKYMWWIVAISVVLMCIDIWDMASEGRTINPNALIDCLGSLFLCLCIGASEEFEFRGILTGGIMAKSGATKRGIWFAVIAGALVFGSAHVSWDELDFGNIYSVAQALLKILQTGMYAVMLSAVVFKTKSLIGAALVHAIDDYLLFISSGIFGEELVIEYVTTSSKEEAISTIIFYVIICALYVPTFIKAIRTIQREVTAPDFGLFMPEQGELPPAGVMAGDLAWQQQAAWQQPYEGYPLQQAADPYAQAYGQQPVAPGAYVAPYEAPQQAYQQPYAPQQQIQPYAQPYEQPYVPQPSAQPYGQPAQPYAPQPAQPYAPGSKYGAPQQGGQQGRPPAPMGW